MTEDETVGCITDSMDISLNKLQEMAKKIKSDTVSTASLSISHEVIGPDVMIFVF